MQAAESAVKQAGKELQAAAKAVELAEKLVADVQKRCVARLRPAPMRRVRARLAARAWAVVAPGGPCHGGGDQVP